MLVARHFVDGDVVVLDDPTGLLARLDRGVVWVDLVDQTPEELALVQDQLSLHDLAIEDVTKHGQRAKLELYPAHAFLVAKSAELAEVDMFIGPTWLVTVRERNERGAVWEPTRCEEHFLRLVDGRPEVGHLVYVLLDELVDGYFDALDATEELLESLEDRVFAETAADERAIQQDLFTIRRQLLEFRRAVVPMRDVLLSLLRRDVPWIANQVQVRLQDVYDHVVRATDQVDALRELMGNAVDAHLAIISNRVNQVMKRLTAWGSILFGAGLVAGIYGMNFQHMPELGWQLGYPMALGTMLALSTVLYVVFKRRDWL